jgi:hypothetical protein
MHVFPQRLTPTYINSYPKEEIGKLQKEYTRETFLTSSLGLLGLDSFLLGLLCG